MAVLAARDPGKLPRLGRPLLRLLCLALVLTGTAAALTACFSPEQPGCAFSCARDGLCPSGYSCHADQLCHRDDGQGACTLTGPTTDASRDVAPDHASPDASDGGE
jgi:hypothetical protein